MKEKYELILSSGVKSEIWLTDDEYHELRHCIVYNTHFNNDELLIDGKDVALLKKIDTSDIT